MAILPSYQQTRSILELCYFVSTIALTAIAGYGLKQISILKRDIHVRNERAAKEQAIAISARFIESAELSKQYHDALKAANLAPYRGPIGDFTVASLSLEAKKQAHLKAAPLAKYWMANLNQLEALAASFASGVADEKLGYKILGLGFCRSVEHKYDVMCLHRGSGKPESNYWKNIIALYKIWADRLKTEGLKLRRDEIESQLNDSLDQDVPPIGTRA